MEDDAPAAVSEQRARWALVLSLVWPALLALMIVWARSDWTF